jgi:hypothetical protein
VRVRMRKETTKRKGLEAIEYRRGMLETGTKPEKLPVKILRGIDIPAEVRAAVSEEGLLKLGGVYGDRNIGDPVEYDHLRLILTDGVVEITVFNRGITLFVSDDERVKRIHRVLCKLGRPQDGSL